MLYIPQDPAADRPDAESQMNDPASLRSEVKKLIEFRQANPALQSRGSIEFISDGYPMVYKRSDGSQTIAVIINPSAEKAEVGGLPGRVVYTVCGSAEVNGGTVKVDGCTAAFVEL